MQGQGITAQNGKEVGTVSESTRNQSRKSKSFKFLLTWRTLGRTIMTTTDVDQLEKMWAGSDSSSSSESDTAVSEKAEEVEESKLE